MPNHTPDQPWLQRLLGFFRSPVRTVGDVVFRDADAEARRQGLEVTSSRWGLVRSYRDPRFDNVSRCSRCLGTGEAYATGRRCSACEGSGRVSAAEVP